MVNSLATDRATEGWLSVDDLLTDADDECACAETANKRKICEFLFIITKRKNRAIN